MQALIEASGLSPLENVLTLIEPAILEQALRNEAARAAAVRRQPDAALYRRRATGKTLRGLAPRLPGRDARLPPSRTDLYSQNDDTAARVVAAGGGIEDVLGATRLRTRENLLRLIDPAILKQALRNDATRASHRRVQPVAARGRTSSPISPLA
jgi:hypothetical protein